MADQNYCVTYKVLLAIVRAIENLHKYLYRPLFVLLIMLDSNVSSSLRIQKIKSHIGYKFKNMISELNMEQVIVTEILMHYQYDCVLQIANISQTLKIVNQKLVKSNIR